MHSQTGIRMSTKKVNKLDNQDNSSFMEILMNDNSMNGSNNKSFICNKPCKEQINRNCEVVTRLFMSKNEKECVNKNNKKKRDDDKKMKEFKCNRLTKTYRCSDESIIKKECETATHKSKGLKKNRQTKSEECICDSRGKQQVSMIQSQTFHKLEEYDYTSLPWPVKKKYIEILKIYGFPFESIGQFDACKPKLTKKSSKTTQTPSLLVHEAINEGNELFTKMGYEGQLVNWLDHVFKATPKPKNPHKYLKKNFPSGEIKSSSENLKFLEKLKHILAFENELAFELAQIKLLCGMVDEETFGYDGRSRANWETEVKNRNHLKKRTKLKCLLMKVINLKEEIVQEKKKVYKEKFADKQAIRNQVVEDLKLWKNYKPPKLETFVRETKIPPDDGRIRDWFQCLRVPDAEGRGQAPVYEMDDEEAVREPPKVDIDEPVDSAFLYDDYS